MKKMVIIGAIVLVLLGGGAAAYFFLAGEDPAPTAAAEGETAESQEEDFSDSEPIYLPLSPAFVVNFDYQGEIRYLQITLNMMTFDQEVVDKVEMHMPAVRNSLIMLFSAEDYGVLATMEGKEKLRIAVRDAINEVVRLNEKNGVAEVFFTGFVMQ